MKKVYLLTALTLFITNSLISQAQDKQIQLTNEPSLNLVDALKLSNDYLKEQKLDLSKHYLGPTEYLLIYYYGENYI